MDRQKIIDRIRETYKNLSSSSIEKLHKVIDILGVDEIVYDDVIRLYCYVNIAASIESVENAMYGIKKFTQADKKKMQEILLRYK